MATARSTEADKVITGQPADVRVGQLLAIELATDLVAVAVRADDESIAVG